jgi:NADPH-dependent ferric siderophore reductase
MKRQTTVSRIEELSPHLRRIVLTGDSLADFPADMTGSYVKVIISQSDDEAPKMRSYTIRSFDAAKRELALDFVVNRHSGPATNWAAQAEVGEQVEIAGPGPLKMTQHDHHSYLLVGDITSLNAINGYIPRYRSDADVRVIISVPTRDDIIAMDYDDASNTVWFIEDEASETLEKTVMRAARGMHPETHVFIGLEARSIRALRPQLQEELGFSRLNTFAVGYWKRGVDADRFGRQKKANPL